MRVLIIEDDAELAVAIERRTRCSLPHAELHAVATLDAALRFVDTEPIDAAVIDLRIPSEVGRSPEIEHGKAIEAHISNVQPGTLRVFLTAFEAAEVVDALRYGKSGDFLAEGTAFCVVDYVLKDGVSSLDACVDRLLEHHARLLALDSLPLETLSSLDLDVRRAIAVTVRLAGGVRGRVITQEGLSAATTALVECIDAHGAVIGNAFCKTGSPFDIERERRGYQLAQYRLPSNAMPSLLQQLDVGMGRSRALVFTKAPTSTSFYDLVSRSPDDAANVVDQLPAVLAPWLTDARRRRFELSELIAGGISEQIRSRFANEIADLKLDALAGIEVDLMDYLQHGDLHGKNLFVTDQGTPFLIDFALTRLAHGPVDPVSLELSMIFHPDSPAYDIVDESLCAEWFDDDTIAAVPLIAAVARPVRAWSDTVSISGRLDRAVATLEYALWVLKVTSRPTHALAIARAALSELLSAVSKIDARPI